MHIRDALKRYFDYDMTSFPQVNPYNYDFHYDGRRYQFNKEGLNWARIYATVLHARRVAGNRIEMTGHYYLPDEHNRITGKFRALAKPHVWRGKPTWAIIEIDYPIK